jgi:hypothetical protein
MQQNRDPQYHLNFYRELLVMSRYFRSGRAQHTQFLHHAALARQRYLACKRAK